MTDDSTSRLPDFKEIAPQIVDGIVTMPATVLHDLMRCLSPSALELSTRSANCLHHLQVNALAYLPHPVATIGDIARMSDDTLMLTPHFGRKSLKEIRSLVPYDRGAPRCVVVQSFDPPIFEFWR